MALTGNSCHLLLLIGTWRCGKLERTTQIWHLIVSPICRTSVQDFRMIVFHLVHLIPSWKQSPLSGWSFPLLGLLLPSLPCFCLSESYIKENIVQQLDIRIYYDLGNAIIHKAEGQVEYCILRGVINLISKTAVWNICFIIFKTSAIL